MEDFPKVSVVTITYGHEDFIIQTLDGILMQDYLGEIEFIIANDNSPDDTNKVIMTYFVNKVCPKNFSIKYTRHKYNKGMMPNFIWALKQCEGKYVALCEGDDYWTDPCKLSKQVNLLEKNKAVGIVHSCYQVLKGNGSNFSRRNQIKRNNEYKYYLESGDIRTLTVCFRAEFLTEYFILCEQKFMIDAVSGDRALFLLIAQYSKIYFVDESTGVYREDSPNSVSNFSSMKKDFLFKLNTSILNQNLYKYFNINFQKKQTEDSIIYYSAILEHRKNFIKVYLEFLRHNVKINYYRNYIFVLLKITFKEKDF